MSVHTQEDFLQEAISTLRKTGVRITPQRQAILQYLIATDSHPSADEIYKALSPNFPNMSVATVYNNLKVFKESGLVKELTYGDAASRFDFDTQNHYHIICTSCGKIKDFHYPRLDEVENIAEHITGYAVTHHRMEIYGVCPECQNKNGN
ncbi:peroxide-responsive transcriptional repressor PerR [Macrococcoides caseolyticum]|uniref:Transcriptional repressor n=1 Tax=Macrococcoides caseolyticum TaxID=69966 RepID=A0ACC9MQ51_9STAP|nr:peroxide-responsive transcriptional repressor PerR [Macrococcus caseolyticus]PKE19496.1 transcriptional repressor [Macrococcus caseolyticus]PKE38706.1 transcriptional repressor [Macrococcus caseolyticus]PKE55807.1 transcriptional repressor [Macrococcus caseolyticus]PKE61230.1 transcriptional repressor [Macrococcus caseolyticus]PKF41007.1 transcriptional repressor [Macrococcus caseolyticus]